MKIITDQKHLSNSTLSKKIRTLKKRLDDYYF